VSAQEIIEQIMALPPSDKTKVLEFVRNTFASDSDIRYATAEDAKTAGDAVVKQFDSVFRKLAQ
jgi:hypothetical protein